MVNAKKHNEKKDSAKVEILKWENLPPRKNAIGGFNKAYSRLEFLDLDEAKAKPSPNLRGYTHKQALLIRLSSLALLSVTGGLFCGLITSLIFGGWAFTLGLIMGGLLGLVIAALFWA